MFFNNISYINGIGNSELRKAVHQSAWQIALPKEVAIFSIVALFLFIIVTLATIIIIRLRLKTRTLEKEKFELQYLQIAREKDQLENLLKQDEGRNIPAREVLRDRMEMLNRFFTASIIDNPAEYRKAQKELETLIADKKRFLESTRGAFAESHPDFIDKLQEKGLNDWEINYCCLHALGLTGKEIGDYLQTRSHYNHSLEIRKKLGLSEQHTKLSTYISQALDETMKLL